MSTQCQRRRQQFKCDRIAPLWRLPRFLFALFPRCIQLQDVYIFSVTVDAHKPTITLKNTLRYAMMSDYVLACGLYLCAWAEWHLYTVSLKKHKRKWCLVAERSTMTVWWQSERKNERVRPVKVHYNLIKQEVKKLCDSLVKYNILYSAVTTGDLLLYCPFLALSTLVSIAAFSGRQWSNL